jgi:hypothetical protein
MKSNQATSRRQTIGRFDRLAVVVGLTFLVSTSLAAAEGVRTIHREQNIDHRQVGYVDVTIAPNGAVAITTKFSNGKQISGNNFYAVTQFVGKDKTIIKAVIQEKGLDGSWFGRAREGSVTNTFMMTPAELENFADISTRMGVRNCGLEVVEMKNLSDWTFSVKECSGAPDMKVGAPKHIPN